MTTAKLPSLAELETLVHQDPGGRRLPAVRVQGNYLDVGQLALATDSLAAADSVAIVTGFCALDVDPGRPPKPTGLPVRLPGRALLELEIRVQLITDCYAAPVLTAGCRCWRLPADMVLEAPWQSGDPEARARCIDWCRQLPAASDWTHLIAIERPGPSHGRAGTGGSCHNMRGAVIDAVTAPLHVLFEPRVSSCG